MNIDREAMLQAVETAAKDQPDGNQSTEPDATSSAGEGEGGAQQPASSQGALQKQTGPEGGGQEPEGKEGDQYSIDEILKLVNDEGSSEPDGGQDNSFMGDIDVSSIPEELLPVYKSFQKGFTQKTQELAEQRKEMEKLSAGLTEELEAVRQLREQIAGRQQDDDYEYDDDVEDPRIKELIKRQEQLDAERKMDAIRNAVGMRFQMIAQDPRIGPIVANAQEQIAGQLADPTVSRVMAQLGPERAPEVLDMIVSQHIVNNIDSVFQDWFTQKIQTLKEKAKTKKESLGLETQSRNAKEPDEGNEKEEYGSYREALIATMKKHGMAV